MKSIWLFLFLTGLLPAQNTSCFLSGTVHDATGAVVPNQTVSLEDTRTGFRRTARTTAAGFFSFPDLDPSTFRLSVAAAGFKQYQLSGIAINSGEHRSLGVIRLELGAVSESVSVEAEVNPVMLASGEKAATLTGAEINDLTLRGRDFFEAVSLLPGVVDTQESRDAPASNSIDNISIAGGRTSTKNMTIDGVANIDTGANVYVHTMPSMDAISEVKVLMSNYSAEYGRNAGGTITVITKGGTKDFHGSASWFHRHESFNANNFFNNRAGLNRPLYRYNIAGYTIGGPVYVPGRFNPGRSKLFFFFSQEFQRQLANYGTKMVSVPTQLERQGDFSRTFDVNGKLVTVYDPITGKALPGNTVPASRFSKAGMAVLNLFPMPNFVDPQPSRIYQWNYIASQSAPYPRRTETLRVDYSPRQNVQLYTRLSRTSDEQHANFGMMTNGSVNFPLAPVLWSQPGRAAMLHTTVTLSPTTFNEFIFGLSQRQSNYALEFPQQLGRQALGIDIPQWNAALNPIGVIPNMSFSSVPNYANPSLHAALPAYIFNPMFSIAENFSRVAGTHTLKFGVYWERTRMDRSAPVNTRGTISFDRDRRNPTDTNYAYANALTGVYTSYSEASARPRGQYILTNFEWYAQDTWRVHRRLSLDYGLRFYRDLPPYDNRYQMASFDMAAYNPAAAPTLLRPGYDSAKQKVAVDPLTGAVYPQAMIGAYAPGRGDPAAGMIVANRNGVPKTIYRTAGVTLAPRAGFAWDPFGRGSTAIRGGGGIFYDRMVANPTQNLISNPPMVYTPTVYYGTIENLQATAGTGVLSPSTVTGLTGWQPVPTVYNFSFGIQQRIGRLALVDVSYVGALSRHFPGRTNVNAVPAGARFLDLHPENRDPTATNSSLNTNFLRPLPSFGDINVYEFGDTSNYNGLLVSAARRMSRGVQVSGAYTFSKSLGVGTSETSSHSPFFPARSRNYGPQSIDRTHVFAGRFTWKLPNPGKRCGWKPAAAVLGHWEIGGIMRAQSGAPFTPGLSTVDGQDITGTPSESARPDVADPPAAPVNRFGRPARGSFGNTGVGVLRNYGINNWDLSLNRRFPLGEHGRTLQLRIETYNTFNHTQFSAVSTTARFDTRGNQVDPLFLQPTAARAGRVLQGAAVLRW